ncbi:molybdate ABC transporter substrate-binding protein [Microlunatus aurantiacus]|uniref:Molybdate ABC transporter substrate-binding protein n=1 Tax=Microlunatus aurantiacus TaxID=446786 RepID=A0ABP7CYJ3_9ACTN
MNRRRVLAAAATALLLVGAGCSTTAEPSGSTSGSAPAATRTLTVFAAASLTNTFTELGTRFEATHAETTVTFSFGGSSALVTQLQQGAPADVFASADTSNMDKAAGDELVQGDPVAFASNTLEIAVPPDNPAKITSFADLARDGVTVVVCAPQVPCGAATQRVETATTVDLSPVSEENSVTDVLNKVTSGEADAGLVYRTDVRGAGDKVTGIAFPESGEAVNIYPIAVLSGSEEAALAQQFVDQVTGADGQQVLAAAGFGRP